MSRERHPPGGPVPGASGRRGRTPAGTPGGALRVLHLEASARDSQDVERELSRHFERLQLHRVDTAEAFGAALEEGPFDVVIADDRPTGAGALAALGALDASGKDIPLLVVAGAAGPGLARRVMGAGARDVLVKGDLERLNPAIERELDDAVRRREAAEHHGLARDALQASEARYRRLFEAAKDGILILDAATGAIVEVNPFMLELTGYGRADFLGRQLWEIGPFKDMAASKASFAALKANAYVRYDDLPLLARDGKKVAVEFISNVYRVAGQDVIQCNIRDISARKRAEREHRALEDQLRTSQRMEAIGSLAGGVAHDFNNLLSVILSFNAFSLETAPAGSELHGDLLEVKRAAERATVLTRQLLAFSRRQVLEPVRLDLNEVVLGVERMLRRILGEDLELAHVLASDLGPVRADRGQMEQVLLNLAVNARDAMPDGGRLTLETSNREVGPGDAQGPGLPLPGSWVRLTVADTGCGMDELVRARLFEPFFTTKEIGKGTGLGLSVVYGIVQQSGGSIRIESEPGRGSRFEILLPRDRSAGRVEAQPSLSPAPGAVTGTETVLVVEDEPALRQLFDRTLGGAGFKVLLAADGAAALETSAGYTAEIHLLLTDVVMPRMGGRAVAEALRAARPGLKVLLMSGYPDHASLRDAGSQAKLELLSKPFTAAELLRKVREALDAPANAGVGAA